MADSVLITGAGKGLGFVDRGFLPLVTAFLPIHQTCSFIKEYQEHYGSCFPSYL